MNLTSVLLQAVDSTNRAPDATVWFWGVSEVIITIIIFLGVYYIFKPLFVNKDSEPKA